MDKIASFTVNHLDLIPGVYVSRKDYVGKEVLTTFDLRMTAPNREPVMNTAELHTIEHLAATYLRNNDEWKEKVIYFGPMGCRTGCYLTLQVTMNLKTLLVLYAILLLLSLITKVKFLEPLQKTVEIILIRIFQWPIILQKNI